MMGHIYNYTNLHKWKNRDAVHCFDWAFPGVDWESLGPNELCRVWNLSRGEDYGHFIFTNINFVDVGEKVCSAWLKMKADQEKKVQDRVGRIEHVGVKQSVENTAEIVYIRQELEALKCKYVELKFDYECDKKTSEAYLQHLNDRINKLEKDDTVAKIARLDKELEQETVLRNALYDSLKKQVEFLQRRSNLEIRS